MEIKAVGKSKISEIEDISAMKKIRSCVPQIESLKTSQQIPPYLIDHVKIRQPPQIEQMLVPPIYTGKKMRILINKIWRIADNPSGIK